MSERGYKIRNQSAIHYVTFTVINWIGLFNRHYYYDILLNNLTYYSNKRGLVIYAWVIMSNHMHLIIRSKNDDLSSIIRDFKSYTSKRLIEAIKEYPESRREWILSMFEQAAGKHSRNTKYQLWQHNNHPVELESNKFLEQKLDYIHNNPVRAGLVQYPEDYLLSSARDYCGLKGEISIEGIE